MNRLHVFHLVRAVAGYEVNGEVDALPEPFRGMLVRLAAVRGDDALTGQARQEALSAACQPVWEIMLAARPDRDELVEVMNSIDPSGPPPEGDTAGDWPALRHFSLSLAEPFPIDVFPDSAACLVIEGADAIGCPRDFLAVSILAVAGGVIGRTVSLLLKPGYFASGCLYMACVGPPSSGKTPALKVVAEPLRRIDASLKAENDQAVERLEAEASQCKQPGPRQKPPPAPRPRRIDVDDITTEALDDRLADNSRGLIMVRDELTSYVLGMNQYKAGGKGNDRSYHLKLWSGVRGKRDRVGHDGYVLNRNEHPFICIVGGLTSDMLGSMLDPQGRLDGFFDRFLFAYPESLAVAGWTERGISEDTIGAWCHLVDRLWQRMMNDKDGQAVPHTAFFTPEGKDAWLEHYDAHAAEMNAPDFPPSMRGPWGKLGEYAGRLALILACLEHAGDPTADLDAVPVVDRRAVDNAWRLVVYFKSHARRAHAASTLGSCIGGGPVVKTIVEWLRNGNRLEFSVRDLKQAHRWLNDVDPQPALDYLVKRHAIRARVARPVSSKGGRPPSAIYDVHPALFETQNPQNTQYLDPPGSFECSEGFEKGIENQNNESRAPGHSSSEPAGATPPPEPVKLAPPPLAEDHPAASSNIVPGRPGKVRTKPFGPQRGSV
jgi:hypothetical protein